MSGQQRAPYLPCRGQVTRDDGGRRRENIAYSFSCIVATSRPHVNCQLISRAGAEMYKGEYYIGPWRQIVTILIFSYSSRVCTNASRSYTSATRISIHDFTIPISILQRLGETRPRIMPRPVNEEEPGTGSKRKGGVTGENGETKNSKCRLRPSFSCQPLWLNACDVNAVYSNCRRVQGACNPDFTRPLDRQGQPAQCAQSSPGRGIRPFLNSVNCDNRLLL